LDNAFRDAIKQVLAKELEELKGRLRARVNELVDGEKKKLVDMVEGKSGIALGKINSKESALKAVQEQLNKATDDLKKKGQESLPIPGISSGGGDSKPALPNLKKLFKR
jgi:hypothetical protein